MSKKTNRNRPEESGPEKSRSKKRKVQDRRIDDLFADLGSITVEPTPSADEPQDSPGGSSPASPREAQAPRKIWHEPSLPAPDNVTLVGLQDLGFRADDVQVVPAISILTPAGLESLQNHSMVSRSAREEEPAALALALPVAGNDASLLLEFLDTDPSRQWSEDELRLVEQVSDQLSLALQNANLFEQTQARAEELTLLHEVTLELAQEQRDLNVVFEILLGRAMDLLDSTQGEIWLWRPEEEALERVIAHPPVTENPPARQKPGEGLEGSAFSEQRTLAVSHLAFTSLLHSGPSGAPVTAAMAVPMLWQNEVIGVLTLSRSQPGYAYTTNHQRLAELLAGQGSAVIQNARLFSQTQQALHALEIRERYQKNVASAVSALTGQGTLALPEVLKMLGDATEASLAYFFEPIKAGVANTWRLAGEWCGPGSKHHFDKPDAKPLNPYSLGDWVARLTSAQILWTNAAIAAQEGRESDKKVLRAFGAGSLIHLSIPGKDGAFGCLGFSHPDPNKNWGPEEAAALQTAAAALSTTISREDLFNQVQTNLAETEALYQASAELNASASYDEILQVLRKYTILGHPDAFSVVAGLFEHPWTDSSAAEYFTPVSCWSSGAQAEFKNRYALYAWPKIDHVLSADQPVFIAQASGDHRFQGMNIKEFKGLTEGKSFIFAPLSAGGSWIGQIAASFQEEIACDESQLRRLGSLAGQAAVAVQNIHQLREIQARAQHEALSREIGAEISSSIDLETVLKTTARSIGHALGAAQVVVRMKPGSKGNGKVPHQESENASGEHGI